MNEYRKDNKDVSEIAEKNTLKKENVQKCKDHIFNNEHLLDQYEELGEPAKYKKFDPNLKQGLAWGRLKDGIPTKEDLEWLRHEVVEQAYKSKNKAGSSERAPASSNSVALTASRWKRRAAQRLESRSSSRRDTNFL